MAFSLRVQASGTAGTRVMELSGAVKEAELTYSRLDAPTKLTFACIESGRILADVGSAVVFAVDGLVMFKGYVFTAERNQDGETSYTAYDQIRYLKANASYIFENMTLTQMISQIAGDFGLTVGNLAETGYAFPCLIKENESCMDMIYDALYETIIQTGVIYNFYDNAGALTLTEAKNMYSPALLGDGPSSTEYTYKRDIDANTYNRVKLVRPNSETGKADTYVHEDTETIKKWGLLQYYDQVDENLNEAQIDAMCSQYLKYYNRVVQSLTLDSMGVKEIRAGTIVPVRISLIEDLSMVRLLLAEKVTHHFEENDHTMSIEVKNFQSFGGMSIV